MNYAFFVTIIDSTYKLLEDPSSLIFLNFAMVHLIKKFSTQQLLHNNVNLCLRFK